MEGQGQVVTVFTVVAGESGLTGADVPAHQLHAVAAILAGVGGTGKRRCHICGVQANLCYSTLP